MFNSSSFTINFTFLQIKLFPSLPTRVKGAQALRQPPTNFPSHKPEIGSKSRADETQISAIWRLDTGTGGLVCYAVAPAPKSSAILTLIKIKLQQHSLFLKFRKHV